MSDNMDWVREQLTAVKTKRYIGKSVLDLLEEWNRINQKPEDAKEIIDIFSKLALGHALVEAETEEFKGTWIPAMPGQVRMADIIRIKSDAFDGEAGKVHNGRIARVVGVRYGDIIVKSVDGKSPILDGEHYKPTALEKLIRQ